MNWVKGRHEKKIVGSTKYFCTACLKDPIAALMSSNKGTGQEILQVSRSCLISQQRPSNMFASFLSLRKNWNPIFTPRKALGWEIIYGNLGESLPWGPLSALPTKAPILCLDSS